MMMMIMMYTYTFHGIEFTLAMTSEPDGTRSDVNVHQKEHQSSWKIPCDPVRYNLLAHIK